ncbi:protein kinase [Actinomadura sp. 6K520]|uniref:protein kinase domain-containing protein n=1 Tax=Actinomadura sp. 6K520 TaxID=2530364 RepID=UPI0014042D7A|nr:protein kinase [Actinomadura sp. 6K520]
MHTVASSKLGGNVNRAVVVGIDDYAGAPLYGCVNDATDVASCLSLEQYDFDTTILLNSGATRNSILEAISELAYASEGENLLFYFAGHGEVIGQAGYLVAHDARQYDPGISLGHLAQIMESASHNYNHVITILDCCHAGSAFTWSSSRPLQAGDIEREVPAVNESRCILAACRPEQTADEVDGSGVFTDALTDCLLGASVNWDGDVTLLGIFEYIAASIPSNIQTPVFKGDIAGTVVLGRGFPPRQGRPIDKSELARTLAKAHQLVDQYYYEQLAELSERNVRLNGGARKCSLSLESVVQWFLETEQALPDIRREQAWSGLVGRVREYRKNLADISIGEQTRFGRVVRHLGHGGYGHVWEIATGQEKRLALKVFHGNELDDDVKVRRFANGYGNMRKLEHPRIVRVHDIMSAPFGFVMDAIPGDNLRNTYIDRTDPEVMLRLMLDICETVQYAHSQQVKHRDIKPENIIVEISNGQLTPFLTDFDLAYHETNRTVTTNIGVGGVINYAAPEQFFEPNAKTARSEKVDIFSLAQLMFFIILGRDPSADNHASNVETLKRELRSWIDDRAANSLISLYQTATSRRPADRPESVIDFMRPIHAAEAVIQTASGTDQVAEEDYCRRVGHLYAGLGGYTATDGECRMNSLSNQVEIIVRLKGPAGANKVGLEIEFSVTGKLPVPSLKSGKSARESINVRLDKSFGRLAGVRRRAGTKGAFQTFAVIDSVSLDNAGVALAVEVITTTIASIEQW